MGRRAACCVPIPGHKKGTPKERRAFDYWCPDFGSSYVGYSGEFFRRKILALCRRETFEGLVVVKQYDTLNVGSGSADRKLIGDRLICCCESLRLPAVGFHSGDLGVIGASRPE